MNHLIPAHQIKEINTSKAEVIVGHLIKGLILNEGKTYRSNVFWELKVAESEDLCQKAIGLATELGYSLNFSQHRGTTFACFNIQ